MKAGVARRVGWLVEQGKGAQEAIMEALTRMKQRVGGEGGVIAIDKNGQPGIAFMADTMAWAGARSGKIHYGIEPGDDFVENL